MLQLTIAYVNQAEHERAVEAAIRSRRLLNAADAPADVPGPADIPAQADVPAPVADERGLRRTRIATAGRPAAAGRPATATPAR